MEVKYQLALILSAIFALTSIAQTKTYQYGYDDAGNRISRNVVYLRTSGGTGTEMANTPTSTDQALSNEEDGIVAELTGAQISIFPNPTSSVVTVSYSEEDVVTSEVRLIDLNGKILYHREQVSGNFELAFRNLAAGSYYIWLRWDDKVERFQVIKQ